MQSTNYSFFQRNTTGGAQWAADRQVGIFCENFVYDVKNKCKSQKQ